MGYSLIAPLMPGNIATVAKIYEAIRDRFKDLRSTSIELTERGDFAGPYVVLKTNGWSARIFVEDAPHVLQESREIADLYAKNRTDRNLIASSSRRITVDCDDDPTMSHLNDFAILSEVIESAGAVALFDPLTTNFLD